MTPIYLDYAADTPPDERVITVYLDTARAHFANPNSVHQSGIAAKEIVSQSLEKIADLLHCIVIHFAIFINIAAHECA